MNIDRGLVKQQAKALISGIEVKLFLICLVVILLTGGLSSVASELDRFVSDNTSSSYASNDIEDYFDNYFDKYYSDGDSKSNSSSDSNDFSNFGKENSGSDFNNYGTGKISSSPTYVLGSSSTSEKLLVSCLSVIASILRLAMIVFMPLFFTLEMYFVFFVRGKKIGTKEGIGEVFKQTFDGTYFPKLVLYFIKTIITTLLAFLLIFPAFIYTYSTYFAGQILCEHPGLKPSQAIKISRKIVRGNRTELFVLDLSFILWFMSCIFIIPIIYVAPYYMTTRALYYENFRIRAEQEGRITADDFLSDKERMEKYAEASRNSANAGYYTPNYAANENNTASANATNGTYYQPVQNEEKEEPKAEETADTDAPKEEPVNEYQSAENVGNDYKSAEPTTATSFDDTATQTYYEPPKPEEDTEE